MFEWLEGLVILDRVIDYDIICHSSRTRTRSCPRLHSIAVLLATPFSRQTYEMVRTSVDASSGFVCLPWSTTNHRKESSQRSRSKPIEDIQSHLSRVI